ncbi:ankyrin repeat-containing domain protein [Obelidium mucronatum]|nr:ankyrin repeat-containing domain protein [Obelidium mucronatum]
MQTEPTNEVFKKAKENQQCTQHRPLGVAEKCSGSPTPQHSLPLLLAGIACGADTHLVPVKLLSQQEDGRANAASVPAATGTLEDLIDKRRPQIRFHGDQTDTFKSKTCGEKITVADRLGSTRTDLVTTAAAGSIITPSGVKLAVGGILSIPLEVLEEILLQLPLNCDLLLIGLALKGRLSIIFANRMLKHASELGCLSIVKHILLLGSTIQLDVMHQAFCMAAAGGHSDVVQLFLDSGGVDPATRHNHAIHVAAEFGHTKVVRILLETRRVNASAADIEHAAERGYTDIVRLLLENDVNPTVNDNSAIDAACEEGHVDIVRLLLEHPKVDPTGSAVWGAARGGHTDVVRLLIADKRMDSRAQVNALCAVSYYGHAELARLLLDLGVDPAANDNLAIREASEQGHVEIVRLLLDTEKVNPAAQENAPIRSSAEKGHAEVVRLLLTHCNVDPTAKESYALTMASSQGHADVVELLLSDNRVDPTEKALSYACRSGHTEVVRLLLKHGVNPTGDDNYPIGVASMQGYADIVRLLLETGKVNLAAHYFWNPIHSAISSGHINVLEVLISDPSADENYYLSWAVEKGTLEVLKFLLQRPSIDPAVNNNEPIWLAACCGHDTAVELLLCDPRVDPTANDNKALRAAVRFNHQKVVVVLLSDLRVDPSDLIYDKLCQRAWVNWKEFVIDTLLDSNLVWDDEDWDGDDEDDDDEKEDDYDWKSGSNSSKGSKEDNYSLDSSSGLSDEYN